MNTPSIPNSFEDRMFEQIKSQMGELLTADELKKILETAIDKAFFKPQTEGAGYNKVEKESVFTVLIRKELRPLIEAGARQWLEDNQELVGEIFQKQIGDNAAQFVANAFSSLMHTPMQQFSSELQSRLQMQNIHL